jgi:prepilin-type N-terminal cleavage/methylation domain-containing protein
MKIKNQTGFTLIELLVVIAIIALLSSVVVVTLAKARSKANDSRRVSDLKEVQKALELYYLDHNFNYPATLAYPGHPEAGNLYWVNDCYPPPPAESNWKTDLGSALRPYLKKLPADPSIGDCRAGRYYAYKGQGSEFKIRIAGPENPKNPPSKTFIDPARDGGQNPCIVDGTNIYGWAIYSSGAACWN